jgi:hypothetical protein
MQSLHVPKNVSEPKQNLRSRISLMLAEKSEEMRHKRTVSQLLKRFQQRNQGLKPQVHRFFRVAIEPFHVLVYYGGFYITILENQATGKHLCKLYYHSRVFHQAYCIGHSTTSSPFLNLTAIEKEFYKQLPQFENRTHPNELIPL